MRRDKLNSSLLVTQSCPNTINSATAAPIGNYYKELSKEGYRCTFGLMEIHLFKLTFQQHNYDNYFVTTISYCL